MKYYIAIVLTAALSILSARAEVPENAAIKSKLETIVLPDLQFQQTPLRDAIDKIQKLSVSSDSIAEGKKGVSVVLKVPTIDNIFITASFKQQTLGQAFIEIARQANCKMVVEPYCVAIVPKD